VTVLADASDEKGVAEVRFYLDGKQVGTDDTAPYWFDVELPAGVGQRALGVRAIDTDGQLSQIVYIYVSVKAVPLTRVTGRVVDESGTGVRDAVVVDVASGRSGVSDDTGFFEVSSVPATAPLRLAVTGTIGGSERHDSFGPFAPVAGGTTTVGDLVLKTVTTQVTEDSGAVVAVPVGFVVSNSVSATQDEAAAGAVVAVPVAFSTRPHVFSVAPKDGHRQASLTLTLTGVGFEDATSVSFAKEGTSSSEIAVVSFEPSVDGRTMTVGITVDSLASIGPWYVVVTSPRGPSPSALDGSNVFEVLP
jgi:hypothetical protein